MYEKNESWDKLPTSWDGVAKHGFSQEAPTMNVPPNGVLIRNYKYLDFKSAWKRDKEASNDGLLKPLLLVLRFYETCCAFCNKTPSWKGEFHRRSSMHLTNKQIHPDFPFQVCKFHSSVKNKPTKKQSPGFGIDFKRQTSTQGFQIWKRDCSRLEFRKLVRMARWK